jgi:uncharacterized membrane protein HdeD (DUF308 family)
MTVLENIQQQMLDYLQAHWRLFLFEGVFFIILGICAFLIPQFFSVVLVIFLGWLIVIAGVLHISRSLFLRNMPGFGLWLGLGILQIIVGYLLIADPIAGVFTLTMMMTLFFAFEGLIKIYLALRMRPLPQWGFVLFSGITALTFAIFILTFWSETVPWLLGLLLGINMIILGIAMVKMSLHQHNNMIPKL